MGELAQYLARLKTLGTAMRQAVKSDRATLSYSVLADALYWSDETPQVDDALADDLLRFLLRYRTTLILGRPDKALEGYWNEALRQFPQWIGFEPYRRTPNPELERAYKRLKDEAMAELREGVDL
jgi:hypothetical protein